jgi:tRNA(Ile)-lysidine synthase
VHQNYTLRRYQGRAYLVENMPSLDKDIHLQWRGEDVMTLPDQSRLMFSKKLGEGIALQQLETKKLTIQYRQGGESIKPEGNRPTRRLNALLQTANMPPWLRERLPLLFIGTDLAMLPEIAVDVRFKAKPDEMGLQVHWQFN